MSICAFPAHDLHVTVSRTRVTLALAPGRALEGNNTVGNWKTVTSVLPERNRRVRAIRRRAATTTRPEDR